MEEYILKAETVEEGKNTEIQHGAILEDKVKVGSHCFIGYYAVIEAKTVIEDDVYIGTGVTIISTKKIAHRRSYKVEIDAPYIEKGARIAPGAIILPGVRIGENALVAAGALVAHNVPKREIHFGAPAKKRGNVPDEECVTELTKTKKKETKK